MSRAPAWIGADLDPRCLRLWLVDTAGEVIGRIDSDRAAAQRASGDIEAALLSALADWLPAPGSGGAPLPVICCGPWPEAPRRAVPCQPGPAGFARRPPEGDPRIAVTILPGLSQARPADLMRGPETRIAGLLAGSPDFDGVVCLPGPHTVWAHVSAGEVVSFRSFMTGEMLELLATRSVLREAMPTDAACDGSGPGAHPAFAAALSQAMSRPAAIAAELLSLRAEGLLNGSDAAAARARLSGLLIGVELAAARPYWLGQQIALIGSGALSDAYAAALEAQGLTDLSRFDEAAMTLAGLCSARAAMGSGAAGA